MNWLHYLLEANIYLAVFYLLYFVLFDNETHYKLNRVYLLSACTVAYVIPLVQIGILKPVDEGGQVVTIIQNGGHIPAAVGAVPLFTWQNLPIYGYIIGVAAALIMFSIKIFQLTRLTKAEKDVLEDKYKLVRVAGSNTAFSFFNYVFIGTEVSGADTIIRHELVHINQKHSFDIVFLELVKIVSWFNPFVYLLQRSLKTLHEYIADEQTAAFENDALTYSSFLVSNAYGVSGSSLTHSFFNYNLLKKRIIMLNQKRSGNLARLKYLAALPVCAGLLCVSTLGFSKTYGLIDIAPQKTLADTSVKVTNVKLSQAKPVVLKQTPVKVTNVRLLPPPPPSKPTKSDTVVTMTDNKLAKSKPLALKEGSANKPVKITNVKLLPPPPPPENPLDSFYKYVLRTMKYPKAAQQQHIAGRVILEFEIANSKMNNLKIVRGLNSDVDAEALNVLNSYKGAMPVAAGTYDIPINFHLRDKKGNKINEPAVHKSNAGTQVKFPAPAGNTHGTVHMLNEIGVTGTAN